MIFIADAVLNRGKHFARRYHRGLAAFVARGAWKGCGDRILTFLDNSPCSVPSSLHIAVLNKGLKLSIQISFYSINLVLIVA